MRGNELRELRKQAWLEFKVTKQVSTGNGETYLAQSERPTGQFVMGELGYGAAERPCSDCFKPCTLDYTIENLDEINARNLRHLDAKDPLSVPERITSVDGDLRKHFGLGPAPVTNAAGEIVRKPSGKKMSAKEAQKALRAQLRRGGMRVVRGEYVPVEPNRLGRRAGRVEQLIADHRAKRAA